MSYPPDPLDIVTEKERNKKVFMEYGGSEEDFEHWWLTSEAYPGGPIVVQVGESRNVAERRKDS